MSTQPAFSGPRSAPPKRSIPQQEPDPALQQAFEHGIWYLLALWPALSVAVSNGWGGPDSADKRDWLAGAVADHFTTSQSNPMPDAEDVGVFLLQVMQDEFECNVEDDSEEAVAGGVVVLWKAVFEEGRAGDAVRELEGRWRNRGQMKMDVRVHEVEQEVDGDEEDWEDEDGDVEMEGGGSVVPAPHKKEKVEPEVDEDGFMKVVSRRKR